MRGDTQSVPLTRDAYQSMQHELTYLSTERRRAVAEQMRQARESEPGNDDDDAMVIETAREGMGFVEGRIAELEAILARAQIIDEEAARRSATVQLGTVVVVRNSDGVERRFQLVSPAEGDPSNGKLSAESPVGQALLNRAVGDQVEAQTPSGRHTYTITRFD